MISLLVSESTPVQSHRQHLSCAGLPLRNAHILTLFVPATTMGAAAILLQEKAGAVAASVKQLCLPCTATSGLIHASLTGSMWQRCLLRNQDSSSHQDPPLTVPLLSASVAASMHGRFLP